MARQIDTDAVIDWIRLAQQGSNPASPAAGYWYLFSKSNGLYVKDSSAQIVALTFDGWIESGETWTYASADDPTFTFTIPTDLTTKYYPGMRLKLTQATGGTKYFIVTKAVYGAPNTTLTIYGGTDYNLENEAITAPYYSMAKVPAGFPANATKWMVEVLDTSQRTQATPSSATYYNVGTTNSQISIPIGEWLVNYQVLVQADESSTSTSWDTYVALSTANNSASDLGFVCRFSVTVNNLGHNVLATRNKYLTLTTKTLYYLNVKTSSANLDNLHYRGDLGTTTLRAVCAYL